MSTDTVHDGNYLPPQGTDLAIWIGRDYNFSLFNDIPIEWIKAAIHFPLYCLLKGMPYPEDTALCFQFDIGSEQLSPWPKVYLDACLKAPMDGVDRIIVAPPYSGITSFLHDLPKTEPRPDIRFAGTAPLVENLITRPATLPISLKVRQSDVQEIVKLVTRHHWVTIYGDPGAGKSCVAKSVMQAHWPERRHFVVDCRQAPIKDATELFHTISEELLGRQIPSSADLKEELTIRRSESTASSKADTKSEEFVLLIDNLDHIWNSETRPDFVRLIQDLCTELTGERQVILVTANQGLAGRGEKTHKLGAFTSNDIEQILRVRADHFFQHQDITPGQQSALQQLYDRLRLQPIRITEVAKALLDPTLIDEGEAALAKCVLSFPGPAEQIHQKLKDNNRDAGQLFLLLSLFPAGVDLATLSAINSDIDYDTLRIPVKMNSESGGK